MKIIPTALPEVLIVEPEVFRDDRGFFMESYSRRKFSEAIGHEVDFLQDNHSRSAHGVLRGLHFQREPHAQAKLVRVTSGIVFDVAVDVRRSSETLGRWVGVEIGADNQRQLWIPPGFAHGFLVLSETADVHYKVSAPYHPSSEVTIAWNDPTIAIAWPRLAVEPFLSARDAAASPFCENSLFP